MIEPKALADLEWGRLSRAVLSRCRGPMSALEALPIYETEEGAALALSQTAEAMELEGSGSPIPLEGLDDLSQPLLRLSRMGALDGPSLNRIGALLRGARVLRQFLSRNRAFASALERAVSFDPTLDAIEEELSRHLDKDGTLFDHASDDLRRLRQETSNLRERIVRKLEAILHDKADIVQDSFYTIREGRYVIPIRRDTHERFDGIVHGTSASGATLFIEPESLIPQGNRLKVAIAEQEREELRILGLLSDEVRGALPSIHAAMDSMNLVDLRVASARFGIEYGARILPLASKPILDLRAMRHPLLLIEGKAVVPNDLEVESGRALILSGPNAGGKTVALKAMGLGALMMRAGLPIPCAEGSTAGFFKNILSDVGDDQSLMQDLSTFSAHIQNISRILERAGDGSLVLLDELAGGTDPEEGAALAAAIVEALLSSGAAIAVTTHYESLKSVGLLDPRARNASVGFDVETMSPSFKLTLDVPGASSALAVAERYGIAHHIIEAAEKKLPERTRIFEGLVRRLEEARASVEAKERALAEELSEQRRLREELEVELQRLNDRDRRKLSREAEKVAQQIRSFRDEIREKRRALRAAKEDADAERLRRELERIATEASKIEEDLTKQAEAAASSDEAHEPAPSLSVGQEVYVTSLRANATIVDGPSRGEVQVARGSMKLWVKVEECRRPSESKRTERRERVSLRSEAADSIDVRGMRAADALSLVETALDRAYGASVGTLTIVHGIGEGALKNAIRDLLRGSKTYVRSFRSGTRDEGGERVTVVELA